MSATNEYAGCNEGQILYANPTASVIAAGDTVPVAGHAHGYAESGDIAVVGSAPANTGTVRISDAVARQDKAASVAWLSGEALYENSSGDITDAQAQNKYRGRSTEACVSADTVANFALHTYDNGAPAYVITGAATGAQAIASHCFWSGKEVVYSCANTAALALTLPDSDDVPQGATLTLYKPSGDAGDAITLTPDPDSSDTIGGASTNTDVDTAGDRITLKLIGTDWVIVRFISGTVESVLPITSFRVHDAFQTVLPGTASSDDLAVIGGTFGTAHPHLEGVDFGGTSTTAYARCIFALPANYVSGGAITLRIRAGMITSIADTSADFDAEVFRASGTAVAVGSDICATAAQSGNSLTYANLDFTITPTGCVAGDLLDIRLKVTGTDGANAAVLIPSISKVSVRYAGTVV